jgi:hypothetical protein
MKNSEVRIIPVAADCDRRRTSPKSLTGRWSAGVMGGRSNLAARQSTNSTMSTKSIKPRPNPAQSILIKPIQAILCLGAIQPQPPSCSKIAALPVLLRHTPSNLVKASQSVFQLLSSGHDLAAIAIYCGVQSSIHNQWWLPSSSDTTVQPIRNPQSAIRNSPQFHLIPLGST